MDAVKSQTGKVRADGFTLIELLVVIAIIALLITILTSVRAAAEEQMCDINNWAQIVNHVMRRHKEGLNLRFGDGSTRYVRAEELWTLCWNRESRLKEVSDALHWMKDW